MVSMVVSLFHPFLSLYLLLVPFPFCAHDLLLALYLFFFLSLVPLFLHVHVPLSLYPFLVPVRSAVAPSLAVFLSPFLFLAHVPDPVRDLFPHHVLCPYVLCPFVLALFLSLFLCPVIYLLKGPFCGL